MQPHPESSSRPDFARAHPLAGKRLSGAEIIVQVLADEGVDTIFGYSGGAIPLAASVPATAIAWQTACRYGGFVSMWMRERSILNWRKNNSVNVQRLTFKV